MMSCDLHTWPIIFESNSLQLSCSCRPTSVQEWSLRLKLWFTYLVQELVVEFMTVVKDVFVGWVQTGSDTVLHHHTGPGRTLELLNLRPSQTHTNVCQINLCWWYWTLNTSAVLYFCPAVFISKGVFSNWTEPLLLHWTHVEHLIILNFNFLKYGLGLFFFALCDCFFFLILMTSRVTITSRYYENDLQMETCIIWPSVCQLDRPGRPLSFWPTVSEHITAAPVLESSPDTERKLRNQKWQFSFLSSELPS